MSLLDALLLDPHREVHEVWISIRRDGQFGDGSQADPYNGSTIYSAPLSITSLTTPDDVNDPLEAQAVTSAPHGFTENEVIIISGAGANGDWYDGWFLAYDTQTDATKFKYKMRFAAAATSVTGRLVQKPLRYLFDEHMSALQPNTAIHLSPGVFESRGHSGYDDLSYGWRLKSGFCIRGAGMGLTTVQVVGSAVRDRQYAAFNAGAYLDGLEISDLTVDCNLEGQPNTDVLCAAVTVGSGARHVRIRRVRAINWGTRFPDEYRENFVFYIAAWLGVPDTVDCVFEECVAEQPSPNNHWNSSIFLIGGNGEEAWRGQKASNYACAIRECYVDARNDYGPVVPIQTITWNSGIVTVVTKGPHRHTKPGNLIVQGVSNNAFNGIFEIDSVEGDTTLKYRLAATPGTGSGGSIGGRVSSNNVAIDDIDAIPGSDRRFKLVTKEPHYRTTNNNIKLDRIRSATETSAVLNGVFPIVGYDPSDPYSLEFEIAADETDIPVDQLVIQSSYAKQSHGAACTIDNGIAEGNLVFHCGSGGPFHDTWSAHSIAARDNYYQDTIAGPVISLSGDSVSTWLWQDGAWGRLRLASLEYVPVAPPTVPPTYLATAETPMPSDPADDVNGVPSVRRHCLVPGDKVLVTWAGAAWPPGVLPEFTVLDTPDAQTFTFITSVVPGTAPVFQARVKNNYDGKLYHLRPLESISSEPLGGGKYRVTATVRDLPAFGLHYDQHWLEKGEIVKIGNVGEFPVGGSPSRSTVLNGNFKITAIVDEKTFQFEVDSAVDPGDPSEPGYYGRIWRCDYWLFENNVVDLPIRPMWEGWEYDRDSALTLSLGGHPPQYIVQQAVIRDNLFRYVNNGSDPNKHVDGYPLARAMQFWTGGSPGYGIEDALVQRNIIRLDSVEEVVSGKRPTPIEFQPNFDTLRGVQTFYNLAPDGIVVPAITDPQFLPAKRPELVTKLETAIDEVECLSFLF